MSLPSRTLLVGLLFIPGALGAQSLDLTIKNTGLSIGDSRFVRGVRLNFRDSRMERVIGINATIWTPYEPMDGHVTGIALGLPATGARRIDGLGIGILGFGASDEFTGIGIGGLGMGTGGRARGILVGGLGVGSGGDVSGLTLGGLGAGAGGDVSGITLALGGAGAGGHVRGITIAGFGAGAGGSVTGLTIAGIGAGAGGDLTGITIAGFAGAGGTLKGVAAGLGAGAPTVRGILLTGFAGGNDVKAGVFAPLYFRIADDGVVRGVTVSAFNHVQGEQFGLSIGLLNYAWEVNGLQIGVLNYVDDNPKGLRLLPLVNRSWR